MYLLIAQLLAAFKTLITTSVIDSIVCGIEIDAYLSYLSHIIDFCIVFTLLGMLLMLNPTRRQLRNYIYVALAILIQLFFGHSNIALHIIAFVFGAIAVILPTAYRLIHPNESH